MNVLSVRLPGHVGTSVETAIRAVRYDGSTLTVEFHTGQVTAWLLSLLILGRFSSN